MKRSRKVEIALVAGLAMAGCGKKAYDPCSPQAFNEKACQDAIAHKGYYWGGTFYPQKYHRGGFAHYYNDYYSYVRSGGSVTPVSPSQWAGPASAGAAPVPAGTTAGTATSGTTADAASSGTTSGSSVSRGVFGSSAHGSGGGE